MDLGTKLVVAHFMVGNTYPYGPCDWEDEIALAHKHDIDGFALNVGKEEWQLDRVEDCFQAAASHNKGFKLFMSFDMSSIPCSSQDDIGYLETYLSRFGHHPNYLLYGGKALVSTFAGENALYGYGTLSAAWSEIFLIPSFFIDPEAYRNMTCVDGAFNWNGGWPVHLTPSSPLDEVRCPKLLSDGSYLDVLKPQGKAYMAAVSPWFFTHYGTDSWNKNWIYRADDWLLVRRWEQLIGLLLRDAVDIVQIISWNDFSESHHIGPVSDHAAQPGSHAWVDGLPHTPWLRLCALFARAFRRSARPALAQTTLNFDSEFAREDRIFAWARPHPRDAIAHQDSVGRPRNWELAEDVFWVVVLAREPARIGLSSGLKADRSTLDSGMKIAGAPALYHWHWHNVPAGLSKLKCPLTVGESMHVRLVRDGRVILEFDASSRKVPYVFEGEPETYNFNVYVAMAPEE